MGWRIVLKGYEHDVVGAWRRRLCYLTRAGATDQIKTGMRRRVRRDMRRELRQEVIGMDLSRR